MDATTPLVPAPVADTQPVPLPRADGDTALGATGSRATGAPPVRTRGPARCRSPSRSTPAGPDDAAQKRHPVEGAISAVLAVALVGLLLWLLWPLGPLRAQQVGLQASASPLACNATEELIATVHTNGRAGRLHYRWIRNDGTSSPRLSAQVKRGRRSVDLPLRWSFHGPGAYAAHVTIEVETGLPDSGSLTAGSAFTYRCP